MSETELDWGEDTASNSPAPAHTADLGAGYCILAGEVGELHHWTPHISNANRRCGFHHFGFVMFVLGKVVLKSVGTAAEKRHNGSSQDLQPNHLVARVQQFAYYED